MATTMERDTSTPNLSPAWPALVVLFGLGIVSLEAGLKDRNLVPKVLSKTISYQEVIPPKDTARRTTTTAKVEEAFTRSGNPPIPRPRPEPI